MEYRFILSVLYFGGLLPDFRVKTLITLMYPHSFAFEKKGKIRE